MTDDELEQDIAEAIWAAADGDHDRRIRLMREVWRAYLQRRAEAGLDNSALPKEFPPAWQ